MNRDVYTKVKGIKVKVGTFTYSIDTGEWTFVKNKPHLMRVLNGYGIQKEVFDRRRKKYDLWEEFNKNKEIKIVITDSDNGNIYISRSKDWRDNGYKGNFGDGKQMFLSIDYMTHVTY